MVNTKIRLIIFFAAKDGEALYSQKKTKPGANCSSYHELLIAKFRLKLKKVGKTTRPFRYDLNEISYNYKKAFLSDQCKEIEENNRMGKPRDLKKIPLERLRVHFMERWAQ